MMLGGTAMQAAGASAVAGASGTIAASHPPSYYGLEDARRDDAMLRTTMLEAHNGERRTLSLAPLVWDDALAQDAARYARSMARTGRFAHSARQDRAIPSGENLWTGSRGFFAYDVMVGSFLAEKRYWRRGGRLPEISTTGHWQDVGHYSQMIWRGTQKLGCALGEGAQFDFLVCRYYPAGNVFGMGPLDDPAPMLARGD